MKERPRPEGPPTRTPRSHFRRSHPWISTSWQFLRYCLVGAINTSIDLLVLNLLLWSFPPNNAPLLVLYNSVAYTCGAVSSFFFNKYWTFGYRQRTTGREVRRFAIILVLEILYSNGLIWLAGKLLQPVIADPTLWGNASKLVAVVGGTVLTYSGLRFWTFANGPREQHKKRGPLQR